MILVFIKLKLNKLTVINLIAKSFIFKQQKLKTKTLISPFILKKNFLKNKHSLLFSHCGAMCPEVRNMSTDINTKSLHKKSTDSEDLAFRQWLAGLIDGDGYFLLSKNGYNSCEITMDARDKKVLYLIQHK